MASKLQTIAEPQHRLTSEDLEILKQIHTNLEDDLDRICKELSRWRDSYGEIFDAITSIDFSNNIVYVVDDEDRPWTIPLELFTYSNSELRQYVDDKIKADEESKKRYQERSKERRRKQYEELKKEFENG